MIQFPRNLQNLHHFKRDDEQFVADLDAGVVIRVNEVICDVLNVCETSETDAILENLADKYGSRSEILQALAFLSKLSEIGVLFSSEPSDVVHPQPEERLKIYLTPGVFESRETTPFLLRAANYHLIMQLANHAHLYLGLPEMYNNHQEIEESLQIEGVEPIFFKNDRTFSPAKFIPKDCDGILALSPLAVGGTVGEQVFGKFGEIPVILRLSNETLRNHDARNTALERWAALRDFDAFASDASWTQTFFSNVVPDLRVFHHIPYGVDTSIFKPMDKTKCKQQLAQALGNPAAVLQKPLVGVVPGLHQHETLAFLQKLRSANPHLNYLVIHSSRNDYGSGDGSINFFNIASLQDKEVSPFIFNALDALVFPTLLGASPLLLLEIVACGIPTIVYGYAVPEELSGACRFIEMSHSLFDQVPMPIKAISQELRSLLKNPDEQKHFGQRGFQAVSTYTWQTAAQQVLNLFQTLRSRKARQPESANHKLLFRKHYNLVSGDIEAEALVQSNAPAGVDVERAIAMTLLEEQTPMAVRTVLESICHDPEHAENILKNII